MIRSWHWAAVLVTAVALVVMACTAPEDGDDIDAATGEEGVVPEEDATEDADGHFRATFVEPLRWEHGDGLSLEIRAIGIFSRTYLEDEEPDVAMWLDDETVTVLELEIWAKNETGDVIMWYPNQGTLVVGTEQREADLLLSGDVGDTQWFEEVEKHDAVVWSLRTSFEDVVAEGELRYTAGSAIAEDDWLTEYGEAIDITVTWE